MMKRILLITPYFTPAFSYGGPPQVMYTIAKELVRKNCEITVLTTDVLDKSRNKKSTEIQEGIKVLRFRTISNYLAYRYKIFYIPHFLQKTKKYIDQSDIVLFSDLRTILNFQVYSYIKKKGIPYGVFPFGQIPYGDDMKAIIKKYFDKIWVRDFIRGATYRFAQTDHERQQYGTIFDIDHKDTILLPLPIKKQERVTSKSLTTYYTRKWKIEEADKIFIFVGRLHYLKGIDILINVFKSIMEKHKHVKLIIVGRDDGDKSRLEKLIPPSLSEKILFVGPVYGNDLYTIFSLVHFFIITPRFYEETSTAALQALSCGVPVLTTPQSDIPCLVESDAGMIVPNEKKALLQAVTKCVLMTFESLEMMRRNAKNLISIHYDSRKIVSRMLTIFRNSG